MVHEKIYQLLIKKDEITWQSILYDLVKAEDMDPWNIDVSLITYRYLETLRQLKELDLHVSGKVLLASAILLKIKSDILLGEDLIELERRMLATDEQEEVYDEVADLEDAPVPGNIENQRLIPKTPQPRKRKISIYDLVDALQKALDVEKRRLGRHIDTINVQIPEKKVDISVIIKKIYEQIIGFFKINNGKLTFTQLIPSEERIDKVLTFIPLLHLTTSRKINLYQSVPFGEIEIKLNTGESEDLTNDQQDAE